MKEIEIQVVSKRWCCDYLKEKGLKCSDAWFYRKYKDRLIQVPSTDHKAYYDMNHFISVVQQDLSIKKERQLGSKFKIIG